MKEQSCFFFFEKLLSSEGIDETEANDFIKCLWIFHVEIKENKSIEK